MSKKHPDNPIVGILANAIKQEWVQNKSTSEPNNTHDEVNELRCRLQLQEERINELEARIEFLMEFYLELTEKSVTNDKKGKDKLEKKIKLPYPTSYISKEPIRIDTDKDYTQSQNEDPSEESE